MIISRTPFRISFAGGGTDLPDYYRMAGGCVTSSAIDKYMYITVHKPFDDRIRLKYSKTELVDSIDDVEHPIIREALRLTGVVSGVEVTSSADIPARAGLGSSSSFAVGLLHALHAFKGEYVSAATLAQEACKIEIVTLGRPVGKQDQYIAAHGGIQHIQFNKDGSVDVQQVICANERKDLFHDHLLLLHCGGSRSASDILSSQRKNIPECKDTLSRMVELAEEVRDVLRGDGDIARIGEILDEGWQHKRTLADGISSPEIDRWYEAARGAGALGGKLLGAGGGGFLLFFVEPDNRHAVCEALSDLRVIPFDFESEGSKIVYVSS